ncbi:Fc.00g009620.m01.CDS01 [Cosmosporella sp. VM-42]
MSNPEKSGQQGDFPNPPQGPPSYEPQELPGSSGLLPSQHDAPQTSGLLPTQPPGYSERHDYSQPQGQPQPGYSQQQSYAQNEYPPEKQQHQQQDFPPPPPGPPPVQHQDQQQEFPPPPPGPPPTQDHHPNPLNANPFTPITPPFVTDQPNQHSALPPQEPTENYAIPRYNPAAPVFAPPPTNEPQLGQTAPATEIPTAHPEAHTAANTAAHTEAHTTPHTDEHAHKKPGWTERFSQLGLKAAAPINSLAHKLGSQSFLPETLDKECDKAAAILTAFCKKGATADPTSTEVPTSTDPKATETTDGIIDPTKEKPKSRVIVTIPPKVIAKAAGLAIFTTLRAGFQVTGATGSGILIARLPDGSWGPPSGIQVHTVGGGFSIGLDIFDCVCVINSKEALAAFTNTRVSLGSDLAVVAGPYGAGGAVEVGSAMGDKADAKKEDARKQEQQEIMTDTAPPTTDTQTLKPKDQKSHRRSLSASTRKPVFSYVKSRGFYAGIQIDGTVVVERKDANAVFYGERIPVERILKGEVPQGMGLWPAGARTLHDALKGIDADALKLKSGKKAATPVTGTGPAAGGSNSTPAPASGAGLPAYVDDGVQRPGVGDNKYQYQ